MNNKIESTPKKPIYPEAYFDGRAIGFSQKLCKVFQEWTNSGAEYETHYKELMDICYDYCSDIITKEEMANEDDTGTDEKAIGKAYRCLCEEMAIELAESKKEEKLPFIIKHGSGIVWTLAVVNMLILIMNLFKLS